MNRRQLRKLLTDDGFVSIRHGKHETLVKNGKTIQIPSSNKELNFRLYRKVMIEIRKINGTQNEKEI